MTQRIFDIENEKDMADLWDILPDEIKKLYHESDCIDEKTTSIERFIKINWHDKTEITRPIQEATEQDVGKLCYFWDNNTSNGTYCLLTEIKDGMYKSKRKGYYEHARRMTKQEIEELC